MKLPQIATLEEFNVPTPRYTSYPTAMAFDDLTAADVAARVEQTRDAQRPLSLYFHLPFCRALCWYCACNKVITRKQERSAEYLERLLGEFDARLPWFHDQPLVQLHLGGGTPTFFLPEEIRKLGQHVRNAIEPAAESEWSVEIDPRELSEDHVKALVEVGFNRASLGVQDHNKAVQEAIHRVQPYEMTRDAVDMLRDHGIKSINMDLIYGLPGQTIESFNQTIQDVIDLGPDRLAVYSYAHVPWAAPAQKHLERFGLPDAHTKLQLFSNVIKALDGAGYSFIGMDHFAKPDDALTQALESSTLHRNFQGYSTWAGTDIHAFGVSAISQTRDMYFQNAKDLAEYEAAIDANDLPIVRGIQLTEDDLQRREVIMAIMCSHDVQFSDFPGFESCYETELEALNEFVERAMIQKTETGFRVTESGRFFVRNIARIFDARSGSQRAFSKAI